MKNIKQPSLVSYSLKTLDSYKEFNLEVVTNPGEFALYKVELCLTSVTCPRLAALLR